MVKCLLIRQGINSVSIHIVYQPDLPSHHPQIIYHPQALQQLALFYAGLNHSAIQMHM